MSDETPPYEEASDDTTTLERLHQEEVNVAGAQAILKRSLPPNGTYESNPDEFGPLTMTETMQPDKRGGVLTGTKRWVISYFGRFTARGLRDPETGEVSDYTTVARFRISPEERKSAIYVDDMPTGEDSDRDDMSTRLWAQVVQAYGRTFNEVPKQKVQVTEFVRDNALRFRLIRQMDGSGMRVVTISAKRVSGG